MCRHHSRRENLTSVIFLPAILGPEILLFFLLEPCMPISFFGGRLKPVSRIFRVFAVWNLLRPLFFWGERDHPHFLHFRRIGWFRKSERPALLWPALGDREFWGRGGGVVFLGGRGGGAWTANFNLTDQFLRAIFKEIPSFCCGVTPSKTLAAPQPLNIGFPLGNRVFLRSEEGEGFRKEGDGGEGEKRRKRGRAKSAQLMGAEIFLHSYQNALLRRFLGYSPK